MSISKKDLCVLIGALGILAAIAVFFLVYKPKNEETSAMKEECVELSNKVAELENLKAQKDYFVGETERMKQEIKETYMLFPTSVQAEDAVKESIDIEVASHAIMTSISYEPVESVYTPIAESVDSMPAVTVTEDEEVSSEDTVVGEGALQLMNRPVSYAFSSDLFQFMNAADYISKLDKRDVLSHVSMVYDYSTGLIESEIDVDKYYITGLNKDYEPASFNNVPTGSSTLFSTYISSDSVAEQ